MKAIPYTQNDPYFIGEVNEVLVDPRATVYKQPPAGHVFNPAWPVQNFTFPAGPEVIHCFQFIVDENGEPNMAPNIITPVQKTRLNMITNPNTQHADMTMPLPLIALPANRAIVKTVEPLTSGILMGAERWAVVDTTKTPQVPPSGESSPAGGSFSDNDRKLLTQNNALLKAIAKALAL